MRATSRQQEPARRTETPSALTAGEIPGTANSIDRGRPLRALLRVSGRGTVFERMSVDGWVRDDDLSSHWYNPGSDWAVEVDRATAEKLAAR